MTEQCNFIDCEEQALNHRVHIDSDDQYAYCDDHDPLEKDKLADFWKEAEV